MRLIGRRRLTCYHEAGHALARWWLGFHTDNATVLSVEQILAGEPILNRHGEEQFDCEGMVNGYDIHVPLARETIAVCSEDNRERLRAQYERRTQMALVELYAGSYAEARYTKRSALTCFIAGGEVDLKNARTIARDWYGDKDQEKHASSTARRLAAALVRSPNGWQALQDIADALHERGRIAGHEIERVCERSYGQPLLYDRWADHWPATVKQVVGGWLPTQAAAGL